MTSRPLHSRALLAGLAAAALGLTLTACGGSESSSTSSQAAAPATSAAAPASSAPASSAAPSESASESPSPSASASSGTADVKKVCDTLSAGDVSKLTGVKLKKGTSTDLGPSNICQWTPSDPSDGDAAIFSGQEGPLPGPLSQVEGELKKQFDGSVDKISVQGADEARYIKGKKSGVNVIDVLAAKDGVFYQVLVAAPKDVTQHKDGAVKITEALIQAA
ncbi:hypothetical protein SAMN04488544_1187 [Microlunatus sagamiharensis]|uniref:DUF3558 domain-containing protein n=1 Tax=Microlunatus sagamiharensis TaxID=546874 RepID=A0A1H2M0B6_9ACTN|nr:hypothetical protein [Microlunatus sagamiharensis]SDU86693.1 hypothetical protein SAMN04488544_1187 [Microlunatus sagamiharensis]